MLIANCLKAQGIVQIVPGCYKIWIFCATWYFRNTWNIMKDIFDFASFENIDFDNDLQKTLKIFRKLTPWEKVYVKKALEIAQIYKS